MNIFINFYFVCNYIMNISFKSLDGVLQYFGRYYVYILTILQVIYVLTFVGLVYINPLYLTAFNILIQSFVCIFLLIRFHPFRNHDLGPQDGPVIFSAAIFLLTSLGLTQYLYYNTKDHLQKYTTYVTSNQPKWAVSPPPSP